ncbi:ROK family glucokinase [Haloplasma contractile]|uniref:Glucokinase n=1 Tax=Haloplasma contractile SSD-17B TaxID=1033810 RepID=U2EGP7_9MOLU|nr:ROK family glucokinase [Haloplasma contractile]ERJ13791.1 Transcriptional reguator of NagC-XylR family protein [Haloplasma contractile SSD-17B]
MKKYLYGVDLGGTSVKLGLFDVEGTVIEKFSIKTDTSNGGNTILKDIAGAILTNMNTHNINKDEVNGIGIGVPGPVSDGIVNRCVNLGWGVVNVKADLEALTNIPVSVSNDANIAGLGELWQGGGAGFRNLVFFTLGTGVGGAVVVDNQIINGVNGAGGELGHAPIPDADEGFMCNCGNSGCLETVASATGIVRVTNKLLADLDDASTLRDRPHLSAKQVFDAAKEGDKIALEAVEYFGKNLGYICSVIAVTNNPEVFVFGGGVSNAGTIITDVVQKYFKKYAFFAVSEVTKFKLATLGNDAGIFGAAFLAKKL